MYNVYDVYTEEARATSVKTVRKFIERIERSYMFI